MKKKIIVSIPNLNGGGAERFIVHLINNLDKKKYEIKLLLLEKQGVYLKDLRKDIEIIDLGTKSVKKSFFKLFKVIQKEKPEIFFSTIGHYNILVAIMSFIFFFSSTSFIIRESNIVTLENRRLSERIILKIFYRFTQKIVAQSEDMKKDLIKNWGIKFNKIIKINNMIDFDLINLKLKEKSKINLKLNKKNIISIGRLSKQKNFLELLKKIKIFPKKLNYHFYILGEGEERTVLENYIIQNSLTDIITLTGFQDNPYTYLEQGDAYILSSKYEGFANVLLEANALGLPVLSNKCLGGINEIIVPGVNGVVKDISKNDFLDDLGLLIETSRKNNIINLTKERYSKEKIINQYEKLFDNI